MSLVNDSDWQEFRNIVESHGGDDFFTHSIIWRRNVKNNNRYGEDNGIQTVDITLRALVNYNVPRTWPITIANESGAIDKQSIQVFFLKKDFVEEYLTPGGYPSIDPELDRFIIDGLVYKNMGDTPASQIKDGDLLFTIVMKREETPTGEFR